MLSLLLLLASRQMLPPLPPLPPLNREFRGVWVATVDNIDWPSKRGISTAEAREQLVQLMDKVARLRLNAVLFQIRPSADALYRSRIEPWSEFLTGAQGRAPSRMWDPLEEAIKLAHARGIELHAWLNPYRAFSPAPVSYTHLTLPTILRV